MIPDLVRRWCAPPWSKIRNEVISHDRPRPERWTAANMATPWPDLRGIDLRREHIEHVSLDFWNMTEALLEGATFSRCCLAIDEHSPSFERVTLEHCYACLFHTLNLRATGLRSSHGYYNSSSFRHATVVGAMFDHDDWSSTTFFSTDLTGARFTSCSLHSVRFHASNLTDVAFEDCDMQSTEFSNVSLRGARLLRCDLRYASLEGVDLSQTDLTGSRLSLPGEHPPNPYLGR